MNNFRPIAQVIKDKFTGSSMRHDSAAAATDENIVAKLMGYDYYFACKPKRRERVTKNVQKEVAGISNEDPPGYEVVNVTEGCSFL